MNRRIFLLVLTVLSTVFAMTFLTGRVAFAHNTFVDSNPADNAILNVAPNMWIVTFAKSVPLSSASGEVINGDNVRSQLPAPTHGSTDAVIQFALPANLSGAITTRWRLVSVDGHVISGRINFTINSTTISSTASTISTSTVPPAIQVTTTTVSTDVSMVQNTEDVTSGLETTRRALRFGNYLGLVLLLGMLFTEIHLANGAISLTIGRRMMWTALGLMVSTSFANVVLFLRDTNDFSTHLLSRIWNLADTTPGSMLIVKMLLSVLCVMILVRPLREFTLDKSQRQLLYATVSMYLITVAYLGHSRSQDLPLIGIPMGALHIAAMSIWIGGLIALLFVLLPNVSAGQSITAFRRFGPAAEKIVIAIVATGVIQTLRLHHGVSSLFTTTHGLLLLLKVLIVGAMVWLASRNRASLPQSNDLSEKAAHRLRHTLVRSTALESALALVVLGLTAIISGSSPT
jgi:copper transport protein